MTKFARDEFDEVPESSGRQGVHRTVAAPSRKRLWPIMTVGAVALLVGLTAFFLLPAGGVGTPAAVSESPSQPENPSGTPTSEVTAAPEPSPSAPEVELPPEPAATPTVAAPVVDKTQAVAVYNGTGVSGLAGQAGGTVRTNGWAVAEIGNWNGAPQQTSVIFYSGPAQLANAEALAALLGIPVVVESAEFPVPLVVVLGPGFR